MATIKLASTIDRSARTIDLRNRFKDSLRSLYYVGEYVPLRLWRIQAYGRAWTMDVLADRISQGEDRIGKYEFSRFSLYGTLTP